MKRRNHTALKLLGNVFIHIGARSRLSLQMIETCIELIMQHLKSVDQGTSVGGNSQANSDLFPGCGTGMETIRQDALCSHSRQGGTDANSLL